MSPKMMDKKQFPGKNIEIIAKIIAPQKQQTIDPDLHKLLKKIPIQPICNKAVYNNYLQLFGNCLDLIENIDKKSSLYKALNSYVSLLGSQIKEYEDHKFSKHKVSQADILEFLMEQHNLTDADLKEELGNSATVTAILQKKQELTLEQIKKLSKRFNVKPSTFPIEL